MPKPSSPFSTRPYQSTPPKVVRKPVQTQKEKPLNQIPYSIADPNNDYQSGELTYISNENEDNFRYESDTDLEEEIVVPRFYQGKMSQKLYGLFTFE